MIVVDTNIITGLYFPGPNNNEIENLQRKNKFWVVPPLWRSEFRNVASLYLRKGLVSFQEAIEAIEIAEELLDGFEQQVRSEEVLHLIRMSSCSSYDCEFVVLARDLEVPLVTYDKQILRQFPAVAVRPEDYKLN